MLRLPLKWGLSFVKWGMIEIFFKSTEGMRNMDILKGRLLFHQTKVGFVACATWLREKEC